MYNFIDVNESQEGSFLPSEALQINGEYIENLITGYRTLSVKGREAHYSELSTYSVGIRDGSILKSRRFPERTITVQFMLSSKSNEEYREAFNKLGEILNVQDAQLIFNDEPDKFFTGTPSSISEIDTGRNTIIGEFTLLCADPFKYSVVEYEATTDLESSSVLIDYKGTYKSFPKLEADFYDESQGDGDLTGQGDCGFVAFMNESEKIIQIGDPDEVDIVEAYAKSQTLVNQTFENTGAWGESAQALWTKNSGADLNNDHTKTGSLGIGVASYAVPSNPAPTSATILNAQSLVDSPNFNYSVVAKTSGRTANSVKVTFTITASLGLDRNYFGNGFVLDASIYIAGAWHTVRLKNSTDYWRGRTGHTININVTVTGLSNTQSAITGVKFKCDRNDPYGYMGPAGQLDERACSNIPISQYVADVPATYYLSPSSYGSGSKWHGPSITKSIGADASGAVGAANFSLTYKQQMCVNNVNQYGEFQMILTASDGSVVAGVEIIKHVAGNAAYVSLFVNDKVVHQTGIDITQNNRYFGLNGVKTSSITKSGGKISFKLGGYIVFEINDDSAAEKEVTNITIAFGQYSSNQKMYHNGLYWVKFVKNNCEIYKDVPNKFSANDVVVADCNDGKIYLNDILTPSLGALGNDWEEFYLTPGLNQIGVAYSDWVQEGCEPKFKVRYREVFL